MMGHWQNLPEWAQELEEHFQEGEAALFILHRQVFDYIRVNGDYLPFRHFLGHWPALEPPGPDTDDQETCPGSWSWPSRP